MTSRERDHGQHRGVVAERRAVAVLRQAPREHPGVAHPVLTRREVVLFLGHLPGLLDQVRVGDVEDVVEALERLEGFVPAPRVIARRVPPPPDRKRGRPDPLGARVPVEQVPRSAQRLHRRRALARPGLDVQVPAHDHASYVQVPKVLDSLVDELGGFAELRRSSPGAASPKVRLRVRVEEEETPRLGLDPVPDALDLALDVVLLAEAYGGGRDAFPERVPFDALRGFELVKAVLEVQVLVPREDQQAAVAPRRVDVLVPAQEPASKLGSRVRVPHLLQHDDVRPRLEVQYALRYLLSPGHQVPDRARAAGEDPGQQLNVPGDDEELVEVALALRTCLRETQDGRGEARVERALHGLVPLFVKHAREVASLAPPRGGLARGLRRDVALALAGRPREASEPRAGHAWVSSRRARGVV